MLEHLAKMQPQLIVMAKKFCRKNYEDILQDTYLKLYESKKDFSEIDSGYIYFAMRSVFIDGKRKQVNADIPFEDLSRVEQIECEKVEETIIDYSVLNPFEKLLLDAHYGKQIVTKDNIIIQEISGASLLRISKESNIHYRTLYTTLQKIKAKLCEDLEM